MAQYMFFSVVLMSSASCISLRQQIAFVSDGQIENAWDDRCARRFRIQRGLSRMPIHFPSNVVGLIFLQAKIHKHETEGWKARSQNLAAGGGKPSM
jgi:hypothetical protein